MADKLLRSIKFPTLPDRYVIGDSTLTEEGAAADAKAVGDALAKKADTKGTYEDLIVGGAEQLMADGCESDSDPYLFRPTGGSADVGNREYLDKIVGGTVGWNQMLPTISAEVWEGENVSSISVSGTTINATFSNGSPAVYLPAARPKSILHFIAGHKYLGSVKFKSTKTGYPYYRNNAFGMSFPFGQALTDAGVWKTYETVAVATESADGRGYFGQGNAANVGLTYDDVVSFKDVMFIDLTALFNPTIADYIYSLEQSQAGAGVAWFRNYFPKDYYPYDPGTLRSVEGVSAHETVGFNQWDEEWELGYYDANGQPVSSSSSIRSKNYIKVVPNTAYYAKGTPLYVCQYDAGKNFVGTRNDVSNGSFITGANTRYIRFNMGGAYGNTYKNDICINLSDPTRNGEYEPYQKHTYPLDSSLTLRGVPKLVDGKLAFDGDVYPPSGEVQRRYGLRAYQSGDESLTDAITDGANTVYKLTTPTTETAEGYEHYQICDPSGTEEFVTTGIVPVGHETRYPHDLKKKIETAPDSPSTDGTYLMKRSGGKNAYMALPSTPSANGSYVLTVTVSGGSASYSWTKKE